MFVVLCTCKIRRKRKSIGHVIFCRAAISSNPSETVYIILWLHVHLKVFFNSRMMHIRLRWPK